MLEPLLLAIALAMDATAVAAGRSSAGLRRREALVLAASFGLFQAGMAALGWGLGAGAAEIVERWDHWVAFGLLALIGGKMLVEALRSRPPGSGDGDAGGGVDGAAPAALGLRTTLLLSIATSIDALAAGVTLPILEAPVALSIAAIGFVTFALSLAGSFAGAALGARLGRPLEVVGGLLLIGIGIKTLVEHLSQGG